ncbi:MAG: hypothetical protein ACK5MT_10490 [Actinomycetales bacterium]
MCAATAMAVSGSAIASADSTIRALPKLDRNASSAPAGAARTMSLSTSQAPTSIGNVLASGASMNESQSLASSSGQHLITIDGYAGEQYGVMLTGYTGDPVALSRTSSTGNAVTNVLVMQGDGNLVLYTDGAASWATWTAGHPGAQAVMQDDRNLVVYAPNGQVLWASNTVMTNMTSYFLDSTNNESGFLDPGWTMQSPDRRYTMVMQGDGNLVLYGPRGATWQSGTYGNTNAFAVMQTDGNMVIYSAGGQPIWSTRTSRNVVGANVISMQNDGNVVMYFYANQVQQVRWFTNTAGR